MPQVRSVVPKMAAAELLYTVDWSAWLNGLTIASSSWAVSGDDGALSTSSPSSSTSDASARVDGGTVGKVYRVTNTITTSGTPVQTGVEWFDVIVQ